MKIPCFQVDAFSRRRFGGNPAAVCLLDHWLDDATLQKIGAEFNLSETTFVVDTGTRIELRWFTPAIEVDLCGHATLATAFVLFNRLGTTKVEFHSRSGVLGVTLGQDGAMTLDFPSLPARLCETPPGLEQAMGSTALAAYKAMDLMLVFESQQVVAGLRPDMSKLSQYKGFRGFIATARCNERASILFLAFLHPEPGFPKTPSPDRPTARSRHIGRNNLGKRRLGRDRFRRAVESWNAPSSMTGFTSEAMPFCSIRARSKSRN